MCSSSAVFFLIWLQWEQRLLYLSVTIYDITHFPFGDPIP